MSGLTAEDRDALLTGVVITGREYIHSPHCGQVNGNRYLRKPREGDRLAKCCHRIDASVAPEDVEAIVARHVKAALTEAAERMGGLLHDPECATCDEVRDCIAIVRDLMNKGER